MTVTPGLGPLLLVALTAHSVKQLSSESSVGPFTQRPSEIRSHNTCEIPAILPSLPTLRAVQAPSQISHLEPCPMLLVVPPGLPLELPSSQPLLVGPRLVVEGEEQRFRVKLLKQSRVVQDGHLGGGVAGGHAAGGQAHAHRVGLPGRVDGLRDGLTAGRELCEGQKDGLPGGLQGLCIKLLQGQGQGQGGRQVSGQADDYDRKGEPMARGCQVDLLQDKLSKVWLDAVPGPQAGPIVSVQYSV